MLSKDDILKAKDYELDLVEEEVKEWGGSVYLKPISGNVRAKLFQDVKNNKDLDKVQARVLINSICDAEGKLLFTEVDLQKLGEKNSKVLSRLEAIACRISGLNEEGEPEIGKNS